MIYLIRRRLPDGRDLYWTGPVLDAEEWGPREQAFTIHYGFNAHENARLLSRRFGGQVHVEVGQ